MWKWFDKNVVNFGSDKFAKKVIGAVSDCFTGGVFKIPEGACNRSIPKNVIKKYY